MNLLITGAWQQATEHIAQLELEGHSVSFLQFEKEELSCDPAWVEGIIGNGIFLFHPIHQFSNLKYIQLTSAGYDRVPMEYVRMNNIVIFNARGVYSIPMAEFAIAGIMQLYKHMNYFYKNMISCQWNKNRNLLELAGKTVAIIGCGSIGTECAKRFKAFDTKVIGVDIIIREDDNYDIIKGFSEIDNVLENADIIIITVPLTNDTKGLFDKNRLSKLKDGAVLVNIARGPIIQISSLIEELNSKRISAVLDVFETEPLSPDSPLWGMDNVVITPHNSFVGEGNSKRMSHVIIENLKQYIGNNTKEKNK